MTHNCKNAFKSLKVGFVTSFLRAGSATVSVTDTNVMVFTHKTVVVHPAVW